VVQRMCRACSAITQTEKTFCPECGTSYFQAIQSPQPNGQVSNSKATASLILGLVGLVVFGLILGIIGLALASQAKKEIASNPGRYNNAGAATAGIVLGVIDLIAGFFFFTWFMGLQT
jgi:uncharacterized membrane protein